MEICRTTKSKVDAQNFKPEKHTVNLVDEGDWYCVKDNGRMIAVCCICERKYGLQLDELYTLPEYRQRGIMFQLIKYVCDSVYAGDQIYAHCLASSKNIVEKCGFKLNKVVEFKHGTQWRMIRDGKPGSVRR